MKCNTPVIGLDQIEVIKPRTNPEMYEPKYTIKELSNKILISRIYYFQFYYLGINEDDAKLSYRLGIRICHASNSIGKRETTVQRYFGSYISGLVLGFITSI